MSRESRFFFISGAVLLLLGLASVDISFAQATSASLGGVVQDQTKALIPGVTVTAKNVGTGVELTTVTNDSGSYNFPSLLPGTYEVTAELPGFKPTTYKGLEIGQTQVRQDFTLEVGAASETVEVTATVDSVLKETSASVGDVLTQQRVMDLPLITNNVLDQLFVLPGAKHGNYSIPGAADVDTLAGQYLDKVNVTRDGVSMTSGRYSALAYGLQSVTNINPDLVGEVRLILTPVDAELGRGSAQVQITTRSGTNQLRGSVMWHVKNSALDANTWVNNHTYSADSTGRLQLNHKNWYNNHDVVANYGGPIKKGKTFFFAAWEQQESRNRSLVNATVLTDAARQGIYRYYEGWNPANPVQVPTAITGSLLSQVAPAVDFFGNPTPPADSAKLRCMSVFGNQRYDEKTNALLPSTAADAANLCPGGTFVFGPSQGGLWDSQRATSDPTGYIKQLLSAMPHANAYNTGDGLNTATYQWVRRRYGTGANTTGNAVAGVDPDASRKQFNIKIDEYLTTKHHLAANWSFQREESTSAIVNWPGALYGQSRRRPQTLTASATSTLSPNLLNEFRFGLRYENGNDLGPWESPDASVRNGTKQWFLKGGTNAILGSFSPAAPGSLTYQAAVNSNLTGMPANGAINSTFAGSGHTDPLWSYGDNISYTRGLHAFKTGVEVRFTQSNGYSGYSYPAVTLGAWPGNASALAGTNNFSDVLPGLLGTSASTNATAARTIVSNLLYLLNGSIASASTNYWVNSAADVTKGNWQDIATLGKKLRNQVQNEYSAFVKDDWKVSKRLTLNLGVRWDYFASPYIQQGFTAASKDLGLGLFGVHQPANVNDLFGDWLTSPPHLYLSGYGSNAVGADALACTKGVANPNGIPTSTCDPNLLTSIEFVGPNTPNPGKQVIPSNWKNFGPALGFAWTIPWFGDGKTTMRGGYQRSYGTASRNGAALDNLLGSAPGVAIAGTFNSTDPQYQPILNSGRVPNLSDTGNLVPVKPITGPGRTVPIYGHSISFEAYDPNFKQPYVDNATLSVTRQLRKNMVLDIKYIGTFARRQDTTFNLNIYSIFQNRELFQALVDARAGKDPVLLDQMLAGLDMHGLVGTGYGPVGTVINGVLQTGAAHLRRNSTFATNLANGNFVGVINSLVTLSASSIPTTGAAGAIVNLPKNPDGSSIAGIAARVLRNACDRMANGFSYVQQTTPGVFTPGFGAANATPLRCFPEDYFVTNPQLQSADTTGRYPLLPQNFNFTNYNAMQIQYTLRPTQGITFQTTWSLEKSMSTPPPYFSPTVFVDPHNPKADYQVDWSTTYHDFRINGTFELPLGPHKFVLGNASGWKARLLERWAVSVVERYSSGLPRDPYAAGMLFKQGNGDRPYSRPDIIGPWKDPKHNVQWVGNTGWLYGYPSPYVSFKDPQCTNLVANGPIPSNPDGYNFGTNCTLTGLAQITSADTPGAFPVLDMNGKPTGQYAVAVLQNPQPGTQGNLGHSHLNLAARNTMDAALSKTFILSETKQLIFRADATNVLNHPTYGEPNNNMQSANFGQITSKGQDPPRVFQAQIRLNF